MYLLDSPDTGSKQASPKVPKESLKERCGEAKGGGSGKWAQKTPDPGSNGCMRKNSGASSPPAESFLL